MKVYTWRQNNSDGVFTLPALAILVEANSEYEAKEIAVSKWGIRFDDPDDCSCCGYRWKSNGFDVSDESLDEVAEEIQAYELSRPSWNRETWKGETLLWYTVARKDTTVGTVSTQRENDDWNGYLNTIWK